MSKHLYMIRSSQIYWRKKRRRKKHAIVTHRTPSILIERNTRYPIWLKPSGMIYIRREKKCQIKKSLFKLNMANFIQNLSECEWKRKPIPFKWAYKVFSWFGRNKKNLLILTKFLTHSRKLTIKMFYLMPVIFTILIYCVCIFSLWLMKISSKNKIT